jgi:hypothetical protein
MNSKTYVSRKVKMTKLKFRMKEYTLSYMVGHGMPNHNCQCFVHQPVNLTPRFSVVWWLTIEGKNLDWFGQSPYVQYGVVFFVFLTFEC